jgi:hypothetical protein
MHNHILQIQPVISADIISQPELLQSEIKTPAQINLYSTHELKPKHEDGIPFNNIRPDWLFTIFILVIALLAYLRTNYRKYFHQISSAFLNSNLASQIVRDENVLVQRASALLSVVFNLTAALLLYLISIHYGWTMDGIGTGFIRFMIFALLVSAVYAGKFVLLKFFGWLFGLQREMSAYIFNVFLINNVLGIFLLPVIALLAFSGYMNAGWVFVLCISIIAMAYVYRVVRGFIIALSGGTHTPAYLFLYICALEIAPLLVLIKIILLQ